MVFNATFNNISVIHVSWWSVLLVEETEVPGENHRPVTGTIYYENVCMKCAPKENYGQCTLPFL
jgi:hypothetical protein